jgi:UDP-glucose 4-epimerase
MPASPFPPILMTGASGQLAACIRPALERAGHPVTGYSRTAAPGRRSLGELLASPWPSGPGVLLHLAWSTLPATSEHAVGTEWEHDLPLLFKVLHKIAATPPGARPHFIFFSSGGAVYGRGLGRPMQETDTCRPIGWYGEGKLAAEEIIRIFTERHGLSCTILRISNPYGFAVPVQRAQGIVPRAFRCAWSGETLNLWGDGSARKDFLHYTDFNRALQAVIDRRLTGTFNLAAGRSASVRDVITQVEALTGRRIRLEATPAPAWDVQASELDCRKLAAATGWTPQLPLDAGLRLTAQELRP